MVVNKVQKNKDPEPINDDEENEECIITRWQASEEKLLAKCYVAASKDSRVGLSQPKDTFWQRVQNEISKLNFQKDGKDMIQGKWRTLNRDCTKFNAYFKRAQRDQKSRKMIWISSYGRK